jgi:hypothetical protein
MKLELHTINVTCLEFRRSPDVNMTPDSTLRVEDLISKHPLTLRRGTWIEFDLISCGT